MQTNENLTRPNPTPAATTGTGPGASAPQTTGAFEPATNADFKVIRRNGAVVGFEPSKIAIAAIICMFPTLVNTLRGLEAVSHSEMELMKIMSASPVEVFFRLRLPRSLPFVFTALKIAATSSVIGAIVSEWVGAESGIGMLIIQSTFDYRTPLLYASIMMSSALALAMFGAVVLAEKYFVKWRTA